MRERSVSPPAVQGKRTISSLSTPSTPLSTTYSAEQMDKTPELKEKKDFLHMLNLTHVNPQQRRGRHLFINYTALVVFYRVDSPLRKHRFYFLSLFMEDVEAENKKEEVVALFVGVDFVYEYFSAFTISLNVALLCYRLCEHRLYITFKQKNKAEVSVVVG